MNVIVANCLFCMICPSDLLHNGTCVNLNSHFFFGLNRIEQNIGSSTTRKLKIKCFLLYIHTYIDFPLTFCYFASNINYYVLYYLMIECVWGFWSASVCVKARDRLIELSTVYIFSHSYDTRDVLNILTCIRFPTETDYLSILYMPHTHTRAQAQAQLQSHSSVTLAVK